MENQNTWDITTEMLFSFAEKKEWHNFWLTLPYQKAENINKTKNGCSLLHHACGAEEKANKCVKLCLEKGAVVNTENILIDRKDQVCTPLQCAAMAGNIKVIKTLLDKTDVNIDSTYNEHGNTALLIAAWFGHDECVKYLISRGAQLDIPNIYGSTPVHSAAWKNEVKCLATLLENKSSSTARNTTGNGNTPLYLAAKAGSTECLRVLLKYIGSDKEEIEKECGGEKATAVQIAVSYEQAQCYWDLVVAGADYTKKIKKGNMLVSASEAIYDNPSFKNFVQRVERGFTPYFTYHMGYRHCSLCSKDFEHNDVAFTTDACAQRFHWDCFKNYSIKYYIEQNKNNPKFMRLKKDLSDKEFEHEMKVNILSVLPLANECPTCKKKINPATCSVEVFLTK